MGETLSPKQVSSIIEEANSINNNCIRMITNKNEEFLTNLSKIWEDQFAVDYVRQHNKNLSDAIKGLKANYSIFCDNVIAIARAYANAGGMSIAFPVPAGLVDFSSSTNLIQDHFEGEEDMFGFKNPSTGASQVMDSFKVLYNSLKSEALAATNKIKSINAFGNQDVQLAVASSAGRVVDILNEGIEGCRKVIEEKVQEAAETYINTGSSSASAVGGLINGSDAVEQSDVIPV